MWDSSHDNPLDGEISREDFADDAAVGNRQVERRLVEWSGQSQADPILKL